MGSIYDFFCCVLLLCFRIFQLIWECLLPLGYFVVTPSPVCAALGYDWSIIRRDDSILSQSISSGAVVAWRWLLIGLLGYYVVASLSHCTYTLCFEQFVIVELWLLIWPFQASLIPAARDVLRSSCFRLKRGLLLFVILSAYTHFQPYNLRFFRFDNQLPVYTDLRGFCFPCHQTFKCRASILKPSHSIHCRPAFSSLAERYTRRFLESVALFGAINVVVYWTFVTSGMIQALMRIIGSFASQLWIVTMLFLLLPDPWAYQQTTTAVHRCF